jgi:hypothetical protein
MYFPQWLRAIVQRLLLTRQRRGLTTVTSSRWKYKVLVSMRWRYVKILGYNVDDLWAFVRLRLWQFTDSTSAGRMPVTWLVLFVTWKRVDLTWKTGVPFLKCGSSDVTKYRCSLSHLLCFFLQLRTLKTLGGLCSTCGGEVYTGFWWRNLMEGDHLKDRGIDGG